MKIGRNAPCPCGSGIKFKKCCLPNQRPVRIPKEFLESLRRPSFMDEKGRLVGRPFIGIEADGRKVRAVCSRLYIRPIVETFHEFLVYLFQVEFNPKSLQRESQKPEGQQHVVMKWLRAWRMCFSGPGVKDEGGGRYSADGSGEVLCLLCMAYDIYTLKHAGRLPASLIRRLRERPSFQGARYELAVAALFVRSGFDIEWIDRKDRKHPEFIATNTATGEKIAVEAKSRHRQGLLHEAAGKPAETNLKARIGGLYRDALLHAPDDLPFVIFIDANLPPGECMKPLIGTLFHEIKSSVLDAEPPEYENAVIVTNYSWQWAGDKKPAETHCYMSISRNPRHALKLTTLETLFEAAGQYGDVPHDV